MWVKNERAIVVCLGHLKWKEPKSFTCPRLIPSHSKCYLNLSRLARYQNLSLGQDTVLLDNLRFDFQVPHQILRATLATDQKSTPRNFHISNQSSELS